jgi:predicted Zn finger-like uncharacterized protein
MIIECKNCNTKFRVDKAEIGEDGRMVCCSICEYEWLYISKENSRTKDIKPIRQDILATEGDIDKSIHDAPKAMQSPTDLQFFQPKRVYRNSRPLFNAVTTITNILLILALLAGFFYLEREFLVKQHHMLEIFYKVFNYHNVDGLSLQVMKLERLENFGDQDNKKIQYAIPLKILNKTDKAKFLQTVKVAGYDRNGGKITNLSINVSQYISAHSELDIVLKTNELSQEMGFVVAKMGNSYDLNGFHHKASIKNKKSK